MWQGLASMHTANRKSTSPHTLQFQSSLYACPASSASTEKCIFYSVFFQLFQNQKMFRCREGRKIGLNMPIVLS